MKPGDLVKYTVEDALDSVFDDGDDVNPPKVGVVIMCRANTVDVLVQGKIDRMVPAGWLEVIDDPS